MKKYGFLTLILCLFCLGEAAVASPGKADAAPAAQAQSSKLTVKGFVKDDKGDPMIGVTLIVKGTNFGTVSNAASAANWMRLRVAPIIRSTKNLSTKWSSPAAARR